MNIIGSSASIQSGIDSAKCVVLILAENIFNDESVLTAIRYIHGKRSKIPVILVQEGTGNVLEQAPSDIQEIFSNFEVLTLNKRILLRRIEF